MEKAKSAKNRNYKYMLRKMEKNERKAQRGWWNKLENSDYGICVLEYCLLKYA